MWETPILFTQPYDAVSFDFHMQKNPPPLVFMGVYKEYLHNLFDLTGYNMLIFFFFLGYYTSGLI